MGVVSLGNCISGVVRMGKITDGVLWAPGPLPSGVDGENIVKEKDKV